jgi:sugar lactone lactonase YvrE
VSTRPVRVGGRRRVVTAAAAIVVAAAGAVGATAAGVQSQVGPGFKKVGSWGKVGAGNGQFGNNAFGLAVDKTGVVYVADTDNHRIQAFTPSGGFLRKMTFQDSESVEDVAVAVDGSVWGASNQGYKAQQFSKGGTPGDSVSTAPATALGVAVDADGNVLVSRYGNGSGAVIRFDKASGYASGKTIGGLQRPHDVEVSPDGSIYVVDLGPLVVKRFDASGRLLKTIKAGSSAPVGVGVDLDCNVWVTNISQRRIDRYSPSGKLLGSATAGDLIAQDVAVGPKGDLYVFDAGTRSVVRLAEDRLKPATASVSTSVVASGGVAKVKYSLSGVACPTEVAGVASLSGAVTGKAVVKIPAGRATTLSIPVKGSSGTAQFRIVLKTNGRPTTQTASVSVAVR